MASENPAPELLAIVVCDETIRDERTKKRTLVGLFNRIHSHKFPCVHAKLHVFVSLTNGRGRAQGELRLVSRETNEVISGLRGGIRFPDPLSVVEMDFALAQVAFPKPGQYSFDFLCDGALIGSRPFQVVQADPPPQPPQAGDEVQPDHP